MKSFPNPSINFILGIFIIRRILTIEERIATYIKTKQIIDKYSFHLKKNFGQNFLIDSHVINKIISASELTKDDLVVEVGPGIGGLTQELAEHAGEVISVEIDKNLIPILEETLVDYNNIKLVNADILKVDFMELVKGSNCKNIKVVANLPYYITTPIIMNFLEKKYPISSITVMIQKEVAMRIAAKPGTKDYGALSLAVQYYCEPYLAANVPQNCFIPRPNVDSAVISLKVHENPCISVKNDEFMFKIIKAAFSKRRKTLLNCLFGFDGIDLTKEEIKNVLNKCGFDENIRGEALRLEDFALISDVIVN